jgi:preprotein translocase subunit YajC
MNFITPAYAQAAGGSPNIVMQLAPFIIILVIMYFLIIRPQQKRARDHREMISNVKRGDTVVTSGGFVCKVTKVVDESEIEVEIAPEVRGRLVRGMIAEVRTKGEPAKAS